MFPYFLPLVKKLEETEFCLTQNFPSPHGQQVMLSSSCCLTKFLFFNHLYVSIYIGSHISVTHVLVK